MNLFDAIDRLEKAKKRQMDHGYRQRTPGYPEYASQAIRDVAPAARDTLAGMALPFVAGRGIQGALDAAQSRVGPVGDVPYDPNALMALEAARGSPAGGQTQIFAGRGSQTADTAALERAHRMVAEGSSAEDIWRETGWWVPTPDGPVPPGGAPRYEIPEPEGMAVARQTPQETAYYADRQEIADELDLARAIRRRMDKTGEPAEEAGAALGVAPDHEAVETAAEMDVDDIVTQAKGQEKLLDLYRERGRPLHERVDFPELQQAYPDSNEMNVAYFDPVTSNDPRIRGDFGLRAYYDPRAKKLGLNTYNDPSEDAKKVVHEAQHAIQARERGFSPGGSIDDAAHGFGRVEKGKTKELQPLQSELYRYKETGDVQYKPAADQARELMDKYRRLDSMGAYDRYRRIGGEAEARAAEARLGMRPEKRRQRPPWLDYDVPLRDLVP